MDDETNEIEANATLATRFSRNADGEIELPEEVPECVRWFDAKYFSTGAPLPATLEAAQEEFRLWKKAKEDMK